MNPDALGGLAQGLFPSPAAWIRRRMYYTVRQPGTGEFARTQRSTASASSARLP